MLERHKKKGYDGFKYFVEFLESLNGFKQKDIVESAVLEDPIYMNWIIKNMINMTYLFGLDSKEVEEFFTGFPNGLDLICKGFFKTPLHDKVLSEFMPKPMLKSYQEECERYPNEIPAAARKAATQVIIARIRKLQDKGLIREFAWRMPPKNIACIEPNPMRSGEFISSWENGEVALRGKLEKTRRTGEWLHFYENGQVMAQGNYEMGEKVGTWNFFFSNGKPKSMGPYVENLKDGEWLEWSRENGEQKPLNYTRGKRPEQL